MLWRGWITHVLTPATQACPCAEQASAYELTHYTDEGIVPFGRLERLLGLEPASVGIGPSKLHRVPHANSPRLISLNTAIQD